jgi:hypothetical protein
MTTCCFPSKNIYYFLALPIFDIYLFTIGYIIYDLTSVNNVLDRFSALKYRLKLDVPFLYINEVQYSLFLKIKKAFNTVRYHDEGSKELNACILILAHMVYL